MYLGNCDNSANGVIKSGQHRLGIISMEQVSYLLIIEAPIGINLVSGRGISVMRSII